jgi:hypothetical protein
MRRSRTIRLVLLGGGVAAMLAACGDDRSRREECDRARAELRPDAEAICRRSGSSGSSGRSSSSRSWTEGRTTESGSVSRGGFGSSGSSFGSGS